MSRIEKRAAFDFVRYANCWEDADVLIEALGVRAPQGRVLSIGSAGDNVLALLTLAPEQIVAIDLSAPQIACLELRMAAFATLHHAALLGFLGFGASEEPRPQIYRQLRRQLSSSTRGFWDAHPAEIDAGIAHAGKFERYLALFRRRVLPLVHSQATAAELLAVRTPAQRERFYCDHWNSGRWQLLFRLFFSRRVMGWLGRDPAFFDQVEGSVAGRLLGRAEHAVTTLDTATNPYLEFILTGGFQRALPLYLREAHFSTIRARLGAIEIVKGGLDVLRPATHGRFSAFNLSDVFEYMTPEAFDSAAIGLHGLAEGGARFAHWNMLAPRRLAATQPRRFASDRALSDRLHARDKAFFYSAFHVEDAR
jgi:S-adenosylmethionine-diacylglycerol 3-amino-3-carboxypropyl transferase